MPDIPTTAKYGLVQRMPSGLDGRTAQVCLEPTQANTKVILRGLADALAPILRGAARIDRLP